MCPFRRRSGLCTDESVNGAPFYVMGHVDGVVLDSQARAAAMTVENRRAASEHLIDVLADLHDVDVDDGRPRRPRQARPGTSSVR